MQLPLRAFAVTVLSAGAGGVLLLEDGGTLLLEDGADILIEGPGTSLSGTGTAQVGPANATEQWLPGFRIAVHCATAQAEATCRVYCGGSSPAFFTGATTWGSTGDSTSDTPGLQPGQVVTAVWTGGDPGAEAYLTITGTREI